MNPENTTTEELQRENEVQQPVLAVATEIVPTQENCLIYLLRYFASISDQDTTQGYLFSPNAVTIQEIREKFLLMVQYQPLSRVFLDIFDENIIAWKNYVSSSLKKNTNIVTERFSYFAIRNLLWSNFLGGSIFRQLDDDNFRKSLNFRKLLSSKDHKGVSYFFSFPNGIPCLILFETKSSRILKLRKYDILNKFKVIEKHEKFLENLNTCLNFQVTKTWLNWVTNLLITYPDSLLLQRLKLITLIWLSEHDKTNVNKPKKLLEKENISNLLKCRLDVICTSSENEDLDENEQYFHKLYLKYNEVDDPMMLILNFDQIMQGTLSFISQFINNSKTKEEELTEMLNDGLVIFPQSIHYSLSAGFATTSECLDVKVENMGTTFRWSPIELRFVCLICMGLGLWSNRNNYSIKKLEEFEDDIINSIISRTDHKNYFTASSENRQIVTEDEHQAFLEEETKKLERFDIPQQNIEAIVNLKDQIYHERDNLGNIVLADETTNRKRKCNQIAESEASVSVVGYKHPKLKPRKTLRRLLQEKQIQSQLKERKLPNKTEENIDILKEAMNEIFTEEEMCVDQENEQIFSNINEHNDQMMYDEDHIIYNTSEVINSKENKETHECNDQNVLSVNKKNETIISDNVIQPDVTDIQTSRNIGKKLSVVNEEIDEPISDIQTNEIIGKTLSGVKNETDDIISSKQMSNGQKPEIVEAIKDEGKYNSEEVNLSELRNKYQKIKDRKEFFTSVLQDLIRYKKSYKNIIAVAKEINSFIGQFTLPSTLYGNEEHEISNIHNYSLSIYSKTVAPPETFPYDVEADGNCLFRSFSVLIFGNENHHIELRIRSFLELLLNSRHYLSPQVLHMLVKNELQDYTKFIIFSQTKYDSKIDLSETDRDEFLFDIISDDISACNEVGFWHITSMCQILNTPIVSLHPNFNDERLYAFDRILYPNKISNDQDEMPDNAIYIMWTRKNSPVDDDKNKWFPTHFVPCLKKKTFDIFSPSKTTQKYTPNYSQETEMYYPIDSPCATLPLLQSPKIDNNEIISKTQNELIVNKASKEKDQANVISKKRRLLFDNERLPSKRNIENKMQDYSSEIMKRDDNKRLNIEQQFENAAEGDSYIENSILLSKNESPQSDQEITEGDSYLENSVLLSKRGESLPKQIEMMDGNGYIGNRTIVSSKNSSSDKTEATVIDDKEKLENLEEDEGKRERLNTFLNDVTMQQTINELSHSLKLANTNMKEHQAEIEKLKKEITSSDDTNLKLQREIGVLRKELENVQALNEAENLLQQAVNERNQLKEEMERLHKTIENKDETFRTLQDNVNETKSQQSELLQRQKDYIKKLQEKILEFGGHIEQRNQEISEKNQKLSETNKEINELREIVENEENKYTILKNEADKQVDELRKLLENEGMKYTTLKNEADKQVDELSETLQKQTDKYAAKENEFHAMQQEIQSLKDILMNEKGSEDILINQKIYLNQQIQQKDQQLSESSSVIENNIEHIKGLTQRTEQLQNEIKDREETIENLNRKIKEHDDNFKKYKERYVNNQQEIDELKQREDTANTEKVSLEKRLARLEIRQSNLLQEAESFTEIQTELENKIKEKETSVKKLANKNDEMSSKQEQLKDDIVKLQAKVTKKDEEIAKSKTSLEALQAENQSLELKNTQYHILVEKMNNDLKDKENSSDVLKIRYESLEEENMKMWKKIKDLESINKTEDKKMKGKTEENISLREEIETKNNDILELKKRLKNYKEQYDKNLLNIRERNDSFEQKNLTLQNNIDELESIIKLKEIENEKRIREIERLSQENTSLKENEKKSKEENEKTTKKLLDTLKTDNSSTEISNILLGELAEKKQENAAQFSEILSLKEQITEKDTELITLKNTLQNQSSKLNKDARDKVIHSKEMAKLQTELDEKQAEHSDQQQNLQKQNKELKEKIEDMRNSFDQKINQLNQEKKGLEYALDEARDKNENLDIQLQDMIEKIENLTEKESRNNQSIKAVTDKIKTQVEDLCTCFKNGLDDKQPQFTKINENREKLLEIGGETLLYFIEDIYMMLRRECLELLHSVKNISVANAVYDIMKSYIDKIEREIASLAQKQMLVLQQKQHDKWLKDANEKLQEKLRAASKSIGLRDDKYQSLQEENEKLLHERACLRTKLDTTESKGTSLEKHNIEIERKYEERMEELDMIKRRQEEYKNKSYSQIQKLQDELSIKKKEVSDTMLKCQLKDREICELQKKIDEYNRRSSKQNSLIHQLSNDPSCYGNTMEGELIQIKEILNSLQPSITGKFTNEYFFMLLYSIICQTQAIIQNQTFLIMTRLLMGKE